MRKRLLSIALCLCMVLTLLPAAALATGETADPATSVIVGGKTLDGTTNIYAITDNNGLVKLEGDESNYNIKFQAGVLTLKGATIAGDTQAYGGGNNTNCAIYAAGALKLVLEGANTATCTVKSENYSYGVLIDGDNADLSVNTVSGGGSLEVTAAPTKNKNDSCGIKVNGKLTISGGDITATGSDAACSSYGVFVNKDFVMNGGTLTATGGAEAGNFNWGVTVSGTVTISGGTVTASGGMGTWSSFGIWAGEGIAINPSAAAEVTVTAKTTDTDGTHRAFSQAPSIGDAVYSWKTAVGDTPTLSLTTPYTEGESQTYTALTLGKAVDGKSQLGGVTYGKVNGAWVKDVTSASLDLSTAPTVNTTYKAGNGTVTYIPAAAPANAKLIFNGATMTARDSKNNDTVAAVKLPNAPMDVIFKGENTIGAVNNSTVGESSAVTFSATDSVNFTAEAGSKTTLNATGSYSKAIYLNGGAGTPSITIGGTGELLLAPMMNDISQKPNGCAIHAEGHDVIIEGGVTIYEPRVNTDSTTAVKSGAGGIIAGKVTVNAATIPVGGTLDMHASPVYRGSGALLNNGTLILPNGLYVNIMNLTGSGVVGIGDYYYKNVGGTWMRDITNTGLNIFAPQPSAPVSCAAGEGTVTYTPGTPPTLTLNNATIEPLVQVGQNTSVPPLVLDNRISFNINLIGSSSLKGIGAPALCGDADNYGTPAGDITIGGSGSLSLVGGSSLGSFGAANLTIEDTATVTSPNGTVSGAVTVAPGAKLNAVLKVNGTQTVYGKNTIAESVARFYTDAVLEWADGASFEVNGELTLANGTDFEAIKNKLNGDGIVRIMKSQTEIDQNSGITSYAGWDAYLTDGTKLHAYSNLNFAALPANGGSKRDGTTLESDGYTFTGSADDGYVLTLGNLDINFDRSDTPALRLPLDGKVTVRLAGDTRVANAGIAMQFVKAETSYPCTISGSGSLRLTTYSFGSGLAAYQPLTITGGTLRITTASKTEPAIYASGGLTLSGVRVASPSGATVGSYGAGISYDSVLAADGKPAASVSLVPISYDVFYALTFETNGGSAIAAVTKLSGATIDLAAYMPTREGYTFGGWYADEALTEKVSSAKLTKNMTVYAKWSAAVLPFTDVPADAWYYEDVAYVYEMGLMQGVGDTAFDPHGTTTRGMIVEILYRLEKEPAVTGECPFDDVASGKYYEDAVTWAAANGIVDGYGAARFGPEDPVTREQLAAILYHYAQYKGGGFTGAWMFPLSFPDADKVSDYAYEAMCWCAMNGIVGGNDDGTLAPQGNAERCQVAAILHRFCESVL